jgi:asparagine synthase (glutamine-hydrolysing)
MCGIAGLFSVDRPVDAAMIRSMLRMLDAQIHRGPDDWAVLVPEDSLRDPAVRTLAATFDSDRIRTYPGRPGVPGAVLGARRLSILDLSPRARIPMGSADRRLWITYNGEIYNFAELRAELVRRGHVFRSDGDTEVILHGYAEWGAEVVQHLRGMFGLAILDARNEDQPRMFIARDRFGIKPVYWARAGGIFQVASEVRGLMAAGLMPNEPEPRGYHGFLVHGSVPAPWTTVRDVFSLPAGHTMSVDDGTYSFSRQVRYWSIQRGNEQLSDAEAVEQTRVLLDASVREHLVSDVPVGVFLSGGMDSAAITALAARQLPHPVTTLTVTFDESEYSEGDAAAAFAHRHGTKHVDVRVRSRDFIAEIPAILAAMDQPSVDGVNTYFIAKAARQAGLTVLLSGLGGDEVFWGYDGFRRGPRLARLAALPGARLAASLIGRLGRGRLEKAAFLTDSGVIGVYLLIRGLFSPRRAARLLGAGQLPRALMDPGSGPLDAARYGEMEMAFYLQNQLLRDTDVFGMAHSLEVRVPFLDHRLVEHVARLPARLKLHRQGNKPLLAAAAEGLIDETVGRPKRGFTFPFEHWMHEARADLAGEVRRPSPLDERETERVWRAFKERRVHWSRPWALAVLAGMHGRGTLPPWPEALGPARTLFLLSEVYSSKGGIQSYNQTLLRAVGEAFPRTAMRVISANDAESLSAAPISGRVDFIGCGPYASRLRKVRFGLQAVRAVLTFRPDVVVCGHVNYAALTWALRAIGAPQPTIITYGVEAWAPSSVARWVARRAAAAYTVSSYTAGRMVEWGMQPERIRVLACSVDGEVFRRRQAQPRSGAKIILSVARLSATERSKGIDRVIVALPHVRTRLPAVRYVIAGTGDDLPRLRALAQAHGVADIVEFLGYVPEEALPDCINGADVFVMPSRKEGFGIVFIEALACGVPVVACGLEGSRDAVLDGRLGLLVDPGIDGELEQAIVDVLSGTVAPELREPARLRSTVLEAFGAERFRERVQTLFSKA